MSDDREMSNLSIVTPDDDHIRYALMAIYLLGVDAGARSTMATLIDDIDEEEAEKLSESLRDALIRNDAAMELITKNNLTVFVQCLAEDLDTDDE